MKIITDPRCTDYFQAGHPERPARISRTVEKLRAQKEISIAWGEPAAVPREALLRAHTAEHLARVQAAAEDFDADTAAHPGIYAHAIRSVGAAFAVLAEVAGGGKAFSLMRPPGHHATRDQAMGFCYLNSVAVTALEAQQRGFPKVAVFDFDVHHGNGTEAILLNREGTAFFSIHQHPCYPGTGTADVGRNCFNFPVAPRTPREEYRKVLSRALEGVRKFKPDLVLVSAGFDAYARDPLAQETLEADDYQWLGRELAGLSVPLVNLLEGGYSSDLPELILAYLRGVAGG